MQLRPLPAIARHAWKAGRWLDKKTASGFETDKTRKRWEDAEVNYRVGADAARLQGRELSARKFERRAEHARKMLLAFDPDRFQKAHDASERLYHRERRAKTAEEKTRLLPVYDEAIEAWNATLARGKDRNYSDPKTKELADEVTAQIRSLLRGRDAIVRTLPIDSPRLNTRSVR
jgi:hypothetical protein